MHAQASSGREGWSLVRWFADHLHGGRAETERTAEDRVAIARLRTAGVDTSQAWDIAHRLRLPDAASATLVAELVNRPGRAVVVGRTGQESGCPVIVFVRHELTPAAIDPLRAEFEAVAGGLGGSYEGWSLPGSLAPGTGEDQ